MSSIGVFLQRVKLQHNVVNLAKGESCLRIENLLYVIVDVSSLPRDYSQIWRLLLC